MAKDLSILIPSRNEMFLKNTIEDILKNKTADTEVIAVLDGAWADPEIEDHPDVTLVYLPEAVGQRAATNIACKLSRAKYVMKLDAHCAFDKGFDTKLIAEMHDDWTVVPMMYNLHCFDWECKKCGNTWYQGPTPKFCCSDGSGKVQNEKCDSTEFERKMIWKPRRNRCTWSWYFDKDLRFQYSNKRDLRPPKGKDPVETMSLLGACWMLTRDKYWELNICDENHGSWGQQGTEVGAKTHLSGGKLMCIRSTWFAHMFRTQGGDFGFPYKISGRQVQKARDYSKKLWIGNKWDKAKYDLEWLIKKFNPPTWGDFDWKMK